MPLIDLNSTLGESFGVWKYGMDDAMLRIVSSASIACGLHAGDPMIMQTTTGAARRASVGIGAQPGYPDLQGFGRREMNMTSYEVYAYTVYQIGALQAICKANNVRLEHVKPQGALYDKGIVDLPIAKAIACAVRDVDRNLILLAHANSCYEAAASEAGITFAAEVFAGRGYREDGHIVPRGERGDFIADPRVAADRMVRLLNEGVLETVEGTTIAMKVNSICVPGNAQLAYAIRMGLEGSGYTIARLRKVMEPPEQPQPQAAAAAPVEEQAQTAEQLPQM